MAVEIWANHQTTTLSASLSNTATTASVSSATNFPIPYTGASEFFKIILTQASSPSTREIVHCSAVSGTSLTISRAQEGTTAHAFSAGDLAVAITNLPTPSTVQSATVSRMTRFLFSKHFQRPSQSAER